MSKKKNRFRRQKNVSKPASAQTQPQASATLLAPSEPPVLSPMSAGTLSGERCLEVDGGGSPSHRAAVDSALEKRAQANRANAQKSTGPRTDTGRAISSKNAVKTALTGRTVLLPTDDVEEYAAFVTAFERDFKPVGQIECELVQIIADCHWRLRRIQELEFALYAHGQEQFESLFEDRPESERRSRILLQTHLTYEKQFRNLHIQEARIDRKRSKSMAELRRLQAERTTAAREPDVDAFPTGKALFAAAAAQGEYDPLCSTRHDAGFVPAPGAVQLASNKEVLENGLAGASTPDSSDELAGRARAVAGPVNNGFDFARHVNPADLATYNEVGCA